MKKNYLGFKHLFLIAFIGLTCLFYAPLHICANGPANNKGFPLVNKGQAALILIDSADFKVVEIAALAVASDIALVTGIKPVVAFHDKEQKNDGFMVIAGTYSKNPLLKQLELEGKLNCQHINNNQWESYLITVVDNPFKGVRKALVVAGSDRRGTAYGLFELSAIIGVSPWVWWADVLPEKKENLFIADGFLVFGPPSVQYRGIFINDEPWGLHPWASKKKDPALGAIGPNTYALVFELLLRLKANYLWPAMHPCSITFYTVPENKQKANDYAIVIGSSHCEPLLFNNLSKYEWSIDTNGEWDYEKNCAAIYNKLDQRVQIAAENENLYSLAVRGIGDQKMRGGQTTEQKIGLMEKVINDQRLIIAKYVKQDLEKVPQAFVLYNEVLDLYNQGLNVPPDVTLVWADDNMESIRHFNTPEERARPGGTGVYFRISYLGGVHSHYWLNTLAPAHMWKELSRAYQSGAQKLWMLNVGDIKPGEIGIDMYMQMGWDINRWNSGNLGSYLNTIARRDFGPVHATEIAGLLKKYYALTTARRPEHMDKFAYPADQKLPSEMFWYPYWENGDEALKQTQAYTELMASAQELRAKIEVPMQDAYYQLVLFPILAATYTHNYEVYSALAKEFAAQGRTTALGYQQKAKQAQAQVEEATKYYNQKLAGGKWNGIMPLGVGFKKNQALVFPDNPGNKKIGVAIEGARGVLLPDSMGQLPEFNTFTNKKYYIDIFNYTAENQAWTIVSDKDWICPGVKQGTIGSEGQRVWVGICFEKLNGTGPHEGLLAIHSNSTIYNIRVKVYNQQIAEVQSSFINDNGFIAMDANHWSNNKPAQGREWKVFDGLGRKGKAVGLLPLTGWYIDSLAEVTEQAPVLEYPIYTTVPMDGYIEISIKEAHELSMNKGLRCAVSIDNSPPQWIDFYMGRGKLWGEGLSEFVKNTQSRCIKGSTRIEITAGGHTFKVWGTDPSIIMERIVIGQKGLSGCYFGPDETWVGN